MLARQLQMGGNKKFLINVSDKSLIELPLGARRFDILILAASCGGVSQGGGTIEHQCKTMLHYICRRPIEGPYSFQHRDGPSMGLLKIF